MLNGIFISFSGGVFVISEIAIYKERYKAVRKLRWSNWWM